MFKLAAEGVHSDVPSEKYWTHHKVLQAEAFSEE